jgi:ArsR family transcriptional regulator
MAVAVVVMVSQLDIQLAIWQSGEYAFRGRRQGAGQREAHFPPQVDGDLVQDGVCGLFIAQKLRVSQPTASEHLRILTQAGLLRAKRIKQWTFYRRDDKRIAAVKRAFRSAW